MKNQDILYGHTYSFSEEKIDLDWKMYQRGVRAPLKTLCSEGRSPTL